MKKSPIIIKRFFDKEAKVWRVDVFWLDMRANFGKICCNEISENLIMSGGEADLSYFWKCKKAKKAEIEMALKALKKCYGGNYEVKSKLTNKYRKIIWSK